MQELEMVIQKPQKHMGLALGTTIFYNFFRRQFIAVFSCFFCAGVLGNVFEAPNNLPEGTG